MSLVIIIPTYNESENIAPLIYAISERVDAHIIVVDDNSPDGTGDVVRELTRSNQKIHLVARTQKLGFASACREGFGKALTLSADIVIQMDSDYSHDPRHLVDLVRMCDRYDVVIGSKYIHGGRVEGLSWWRAALSRYGNRYIRRVLSMKRPDFNLRDSTSGYVAWRSDILRELISETLSSQGYGFQVELKWKAFLQGARIWEEPIVFRDRVNGKSKLTSSIALEVLLLPLKLMAFGKSGWGNQKTAVRNIQKISLDGADISEISSGDGE